MTAPAGKGKKTARKRRPRLRDRDYGTVRAFEPKGGPDAAAFFDFDKTLLHGDAGIIFARTMARNVYRLGSELSPPARVVWYALVSGRLGTLLAKEAAYRTLHGLRIMKRSQLVTLAYRTMKGFPKRHLSENMERIWEAELSKRLYPEMIGVIDKHRRLGQRIVIVSTGMREIVEHAKRYVGADVEVMAVDMAEEDGRWTGAVDGPLYGAHKAALIREYAASRNIDLARSYAYSDHYSDIDFLKAVGNPVAVNPQGRLRRVAEREGWTVLDLPEPPADANLAPRQNS